MPSSSSFCHHDSGCIVENENGGCSPCAEAGLECPFLAVSPQPRKRKSYASDVLSDAITNKRRAEIEKTLRTSVIATLSHDCVYSGGPTCPSPARPLGLLPHHHSQYVGHTADFEPFIFNFSKYDSQNEISSSCGTLRRVKTDVGFLLIPDNTIQEDRDTEAVEALVAPYGRKLIDLFFRIVHPFFPICQKNFFIESYESGHHQLLPALLAVVYLLAIDWWTHCPELKDLPPPNIKELEKLVDSNLADSMSRPKLSTVEAALLLSQRPGRSPWASTAQLIAIGQELGLHLDCSDWDIPLWEKEWRNRLSWGLYLQDKWGALIHGRPSHISLSNWTVRKLTLHDFALAGCHKNDMVNAEDCEIGRLVFIHFVELTKLLDEILGTFYTAVALQKVENAGDKGAYMVLAKAKPIQLKLRDWYAALPPCMRLELLSSGGRPLGRLSSVGYLHLAYFATEITLHRRIIGSLSSSSSSQSTAAANPAFTEYIYRSAARARLISSMEFVNRLSPYHLRSFWYRASETNFALIGTFGALLWASSTSGEEADWYRRRLSEHRWTLCANTKPDQGQHLTAFAVKMLDVSTDFVLRQLAEKPSMSSNSSTSCNIEVSDVG